MATKSLGIPEDKFYGISSSPQPVGGEKQEQKIIYPSFSLKDEQLDAAGAEACEQGAYYILTAKVRVAEVSSRETDKDGTQRKEFEIEEIHDIQPAAAKEEKPAKSESVVAAKDAKATRTRGTLSPDEALGKAAK